VVTWPIASPSDAHGGLLGAEIAVGVDLHLQAAIAEDALGHDGDHVHAVDFRGDDEGRGLVIGIGGARPDAGDERAAAAHQLARPRPFARGEGNERLVGVARALGEHERVHARELAVHIAVAVASPGLARPYATEHGAGVAGDDAVLAHADSFARIAARTRSGVAGTWRSRIPAA
jgi:hypothetical protein